MSPVRSGRQEIPPGRAAAAFGGHSLRGRLLAGILLPLVILIGINGASLYASALDAVNTAYDRTLLASAKVIGEQLDVQGYDDAAQLRATVPYSALEAFEADNRSRMVYRVSNLHGELVSGYAQLPFWRGKLPDVAPYAALVDFYDARYGDADVRVAVLLQPVSSASGRGMAVVQVAETLQLRHALARQVLVDTLWRQGLLVLVIGLVVLLAVQHATRPVRRISHDLQARPEGELRPIAAGDAPRELRPLLDATNAVMGRLSQLLENQKRFVRDTAHQLRTPLAVLKAQVQSARRGDVGAAEALQQIETTVERATTLANQMLALAKIEQLRLQEGLRVIDLAAAVREVALELAPLIAEKDLDFELETAPAPVLAHDWMLRELARNILHNAVRFSPPGGALDVRVLADSTIAALVVSDAGPGITAELESRLFQPFSPGDARSGSGLGLAICQEIAHTLGGRIALVNREQAGRVQGLDATVHLPLAIAA